MDYRSNLLRDKQNLKKLNFTLKSVTNHFSENHSLSINALSTLNSCYQSNISDLEILMHLNEISNF